MKRFLSTEFAVGTFALLGLLMIIYMSLEVNDTGTVGGTGKTYTAAFESVSGILRKVPVEVAGIACGYVDRSELKNNRAIITIRIRDDVTLYSNAFLAIRDRGVLGDKFMALNPGTPDHPIIEDGGEIPKTHSASDFGDITTALNQTTEILQELLTADNPKGALGQTVVNMRDLSGRLNDDRISQIIENLERFSKNLNDITDENKDQIHTVLVSLGDVAGAMKGALGEGGSISKSAERLDETLASLERIVKKIESGEGTLGKLINDDETIEGINSAVEGLNDTLGLFRKVQLSLRYRGEYLASSKSLQNLVGIKIAPSPNDYLLIEIVDAPRGRARLVETVVTSNGQIVSETETVQVSNDILFTVVLAKRFWDVTFRAGLIRSSGGAGMDYHLLKDKLILSVEAFDFSRPGNSFHLRAYGTLVLFKHLLLTGGVDDAVAKVGGINPFAGAGLQFTDNDLKALITSVPTSF